MTSPLPLMHPLPSAWRRRNDRRIAQLRPELRGLAKAHVERCWRHGLAVVLMPPVRTDADQAKLYAKGRVFVRGLWHVEDPTQVVTDALTSDSTPHGERWRAAYDIAFLVEGELVAPKPGPDNDSWDGPWELAGALGEEVGLEWGGRWRTATFPDGDRPHFQIPNWRALPRLT